MGSSIPEAPRIPIIVVLRRMQPTGLVHAIFPYIDIPEKAVIDGAFAFMLPDGTRGLIDRIRIENWTEPASVEDDDVKEMLLTLTEQHWTPIVIPYEAIDHDMASVVRGDDGHYDFSAPALFSGLDSITTCDNCGHPNFSIEEACEACNFSFLPEVVIERPSSDFQKKWE